MDSLAEEFQHRMDLSDKSFTSSLELSKEGTVGKPNNGILVEEVHDPYQFLEDSSDDDNSSGRQMSTSDLMQTDADAMQDPYTMMGDGNMMSNNKNHNDSEFKPGQYLQTSDVSDYRVNSMQFKNETAVMEQQLT